MTLHDLAKMKIAEADKSLINIFATMAGIKMTDDIYSAVKNRPDLTLADVLKQMSLFHCKSENVTVCKSGLHIQEEMIG